MTTLVFADPAYDRELGNPAATRDGRIGAGAFRLAADRSAYDPGSMVHVAFWRRQDAAETPDPASVTAADGPFSLRIDRIPADGTPKRPLAIAGLPDTAGYAVEPDKGYAVPLAQLRSADPSALGDADAGLRAGDRLVLTLAAGQDAIALDLGIVADAVLPPPAASYGLATLLAAAAAPIPVGTALFATAPLPQVVEFPSLVEDLKAGHVRRRALFLWPFAPARMPIAGDPFGFLVKIDRTGGAQLPNGRMDFRALQGP